MLGFVGREAKLRYLYIGTYIRRAETNFHKLFSLTGHTNADAGWIWPAGHRLLTPAGWGRDWDLFYVIGKPLNHPKEEVGLETFFEKISLAALLRKTVGEQERMQGRPLKSHGNNPDQRGGCLHKGGGRGHGAQQVDSVIDSVLGAERLSWKTNLITPLRKAISKSWIVHSSIGELHGLLSIYSKPPDGDINRDKLRKWRQLGGGVNSPYFGLIWRWPELLSPCDAFPVIFFQISGLVRPGSMGFAPSTIKLKDKCMLAFSTHIGAEGHCHFKFPFAEEVLRHMERIQGSINLGGKSVIYFH